jgi:hypothetical protein
MAGPEPFETRPETLREVRSLLRKWLAEAMRKEDLAWLDAECAAAADGPARRFFMAFSAAGRHAGKTVLELPRAERAAAERTRRGWAPGAWTREQAARTLLVLSRDASDRARWLRELDLLFGHADVDEAVALYQALPLLPLPAELVGRCAEGIRTNMTAVFVAVAHGNPYPAERLPEPAWNQMVLKALFVEVGLAPVVGLDARANPDLARMLCDFARERRAAGRPVSPELWRCVGPEAKRDFDGAPAAEPARAERRR